MKSDMDNAIETAQLYLAVAQVQLDLTAGHIAGLAPDSMQRVVCEHRLTELKTRIADAKAALADAVKLRDRHAFNVPKRMLQAQLAGRHVPRRRKRA